MSEPRTIDPTVEEALKELREMFPVTRDRQWMIEISIQDLASDFFVGRSVRRYAIKLREGDQTWVSDTLSEAMAQVRAWKEQEK